MEKDKRKILRISLEFAIAISLIVFFVLLNEQMGQNKVYKFKALNDSYRYVYQVDNVKLQNTELIINGWFVELKKVRNEEVDVGDPHEFRVLLYDLNSVIEKNVDGSEKSRDGIPLKVDYYKRDDVNRILDCEYDYSDCGFTARIDSSEIDLENGNYQLVFKLEEQAEFGIMANAYVSKGQLLNYNPIDVMDLEVNNTDLEPVVENGICLFSSGQSHLCIYCYENDLYWITDSGFNFDSSGNTLIQYQIDTTQFDKLPKQRVEEGWFWTNTSFYFEQHEITNLKNCGLYRVSVREIPTDYTVTGISTGSSTEENSGWHAYIRPNYR